MPAEQDTLFTLQNTKKREDVITTYAYDKKMLFRFSQKNESKGLAEIITPSPYRYLKQQEIMPQVIRDFNGDRPSIITKALQWLAPLINLFFSPFQRVQPGTMLLVHRNNIPELVAPSDELVRIDITFNPYNTSEVLSEVNQNTQKIGAFGHYVMNVPLGQYAKVSFGNENKLLGEGQHVIHNENFTTPEPYLVNQTDAYINYKDIHLFNVPPGQLAKISIGNNEFYFLPPGRHEIRNPNLVFNPTNGFVPITEPCIAHGNQHLFNIPPGKYLQIKVGQEYRLLGSGEHYIEHGNVSYSASDLVDQTKLHINHGNIHILNIPQGKIATVLENNVPKLLTAGQHVVDNANFVFDESVHLLDQNTSYIRHQNIHRIMVNPGHIAFVSVDNKTQILYGQDEPYVFQSNNFSIHQEHGQYTFNQNTKHISFNGIHYTLPEQGEVSVFFDGGKLIILPESTGEKTEQLTKPQAMILESGTASFSEFLDMRVQTLEFPSKELQTRRVREGIDAKVARFDRFKTADGTNVAVRFVVTYFIKDPKLALSKFKSKADIERHIETLVNADMGNAISSTLLCNLSTSMQSNAQMPAADGTSEKGSLPIWQDQVKNQLHADLKEIGIVLGRLNIEETEILDSSVRQQIEQQSAAATKAQAQRAIMEIENNLAQLAAKQQREMARLTQETEAATAKLKAENGTAQAALQTELAVLEAKRKTEVAILQTEADLRQLTLRAQAENEIRVSTADAELQAKEKEAEGKRALLAIEKTTAEILQTFPAQLQLEIVKKLCEAMSSSNYLPVASILGQQSPLTLLMTLWKDLAAKNSPTTMDSMGVGLGSVMSQLGIFRRSESVNERDAAVLADDESKILESAASSAH